MYWLLIILAFILIIILTVTIPQRRLGQAQARVIDIFRDAGATGPESARTLAELGLPEQDADGHRDKKDYRTGALTVLVNMDVIIKTGDGKAYLDEAKLAAARLHPRIKGTPS
jgi:hypothetical protein